MAGASGPDGSAPPLPWQPDALRDILSELIEAAEENRVAKYVAAVTEAGLMPKLVREIEADAHFPNTAKMLLKRSLPKLAAKWLNKAGLSAEFEDELSCVTAVILIVGHDRKFSAKVREIIVSFHSAQTTKVSAPSPAKP